MSVPAAHPQPAPAPVTPSASPLPLNGEARQTAPLAADIGGTMTKVAFWIPGDTEIDLPTFVVPEEASMTGSNLYPDPVFKVAGCGAAG